MNKMEENGNAPDGSKVNWGNEWDYQKSFGLHEFLKERGINVRPTHNFELLKAGQVDLWNEYLELCKKESRRAGVKVEEADITLFRKDFIQNEIAIFTRFEEGSKSDHEKRQIKKYLRYCHNEIDQKQPPARVQSFSWTGNPDQLKSLYEGLKEHGFIDPKTNLQAFKAIFAGDDTGNDLHRVKWIKKAHKSKYIAKNAVFALFDLLAKNAMIPVNDVNNRAGLFRKLENCFCDEVGTPLKLEHKNTSYSKDNSPLLQTIISSL